MYKKLLVFLLVLLTGSSPCCSVEPSISDSPDKPAEKPILKIDIVYTWVNHKDPLWQQQKRLALLSYPHPLTGDGSSKTRYRNRDELRYSLRSVFRFAPFVNHIYIVTAGQRPYWLKNHPKITIVPHDKIFTNRSDLPTFNSHAIEANLHHIPGLAERFIYLNDDVFFGRPVKPSDFFSSDDKVSLFFSPVIAPYGQHIGGECGYVAGWKNTNALLNCCFNNELRKSFVHGPFVMKRAICIWAERRFSDAFRATSSHKFRSYDDYTITNGLIPYYAYYKKRSRRGTLSNKTVWVRNDISVLKRQLREVLRKRPSTFCIEDVEPEDSKEVDKIIKKFFETYFRGKEEFER